MGRGMEWFKLASTIIIMISSSHAWPTAPFQLLAVFAGTDETTPGRWLTGTEALVAQAFPLHHSLHQNIKVCSFHVPSESLRASRVMRQQAGNSMNIFAMTVQFLYLMLYVKASSIVGYCSPTVRCDRSYYTHRNLNTSHVHEFLDDDDDCFHVNRHAPRYKYTALPWHLLIFFVLLMFYWYGNDNMDLLYGY